MNSRSGEAKLIAIVALFFVMAWPQSGDANSGDLPEKEKRGKQIYLKGESGAGEITAILGSSDLEVPATSFSCANCHGLRGEGTSEGGCNRRLSPGARLPKPANLRSRIATGLLTMKRR
jgi:mono/diheme cytochrome c family protein